MLRGFTEQPKEIRRFAIGQLISALADSRCVKCQGYGIKAGDRWEACGLCDCVKMRINEIPKLSVRTENPDQDEQRAAEALLENDDEY